MNTAEQRDIERMALAEYLNERGLDGADAVPLLVHCAGEILGTAIAQGKMDKASTQVTIEELARVMQRAAGVSDEQNRAH